MPKIKRLSNKQIKSIFLILGILVVTAIIAYLYFINSSRPQLQEKNTPKAFISEVYDKILENYWEKIPDKDLLALFKLSIEKNGGQAVSSNFENKEQLLKNISDQTQKMDEEQKTKFLSQVAGSVLATLAPAGRSGLYTQKQEVALKNTVENVNPEKDLYKDLGVQKGASEEAVQKAFDEKSKKASEQELKQLSYAKEVLTEKDTKARYDQKGVEPTIFTRIYPPNTLYLQFKKFSPTALEEFQKAFDDHKDNNQLNSLILDLRGNVGGAIDSTAYFLGYFLGKNQSAFEFYKKGEYLPFRTPTDKLTSLEKYKQIVVLTDQNTQSSAEMLAASLKKYHLGVVVGSTTKGWGTVERVFPLENQITPAEKYSIFLVHSITLRDDNQPIEGRGVAPNIDIKNANWENELFNYYRNPGLTLAVKQILSTN